MVVRTRYLVDTNILLRLSQRNDPNHQLIREAIKKLLVTDGAELCYTLQNLTELWNVCTRPADKNGYGFSIAETERRVKVIERLFTLLIDMRSVTEEWCRLVTAHNVSGIQVYDARLAATMRASGIGRILTLNDKDFKRYPGVLPVTPSDALIS